MANVLSTPNEPVEPTLEAIRDLIKQKSSFSDNNARTVKGRSQNTFNRLSLFRLQFEFYKKYFETLESFGTKTGGSNSAA